MKKAYIITNPMIAANRSAEVTLSKFSRVIQPSFEHVSVIGGNLSVEQDLQDVELISFDITRAKNKIKRVLDIIGLQLKMHSMVLKTVKINDSVYFWIGDKMLLPYLAAKRKRAEINYFIYGNVAKEGAVKILTQMSSKLIRYMASNADYICMESTSVIEEWPGLSAKKSKVIHLYTNNIEMNPLKGREKILGMVCRLTAGKHVLECISAMSNVHKKYPGWRLEIIGSGKQQQDCEKLIKKLKAERYITLLGWVEHNEIVEKSKKWRYLLFPTDTEGVPNGLLEMMGRGIPALASPVGGVKDIVQDCVNGFILKNTTKDAIESGIQRMIETNVDSYEMQSKKAYKTIAEQFSLDEAIKTTKSILEKTKE